MFFSINLSKLTIDLFDNSAKIASGGYELSNLKPWDVRQVTKEISSNYSGNISNNIIVKIKFVFHKGKHREEKT